MTSVPAIPASNTSAKPVPQAAVIPVVTSSSSSGNTVPPNGSLPTSSSSSGLPKAGEKAAGNTTEAGTKPGQGSGNGAPVVASNDTKAKSNSGEEPPSDGGTNPKSNKDAGELQTSTQMLVAKSDSGILGSQPDVYNMDNDMAVPELPLLFNDGNEDTLNWIYNKDEGQEYFPSTATVHEGVFNQDHPLCAPDPKGCEGRILRWFDLGPLPEAFTDIRPYIAKLHKGKLKRAYINSKVTYVDIAIGPGNQVKIPTIPAKGGHIYYLLLVPEGEPMAIASTEMNLEDPAVYAQFEKMAMNPDWHFARGIWVKEPKSSVLQYRSEPTLLQVIPQSSTKVKAGGGQ